MRSSLWLVPLAGLLGSPTLASAATLSFGVVSPDLKVRPADAPTLAPSATLRAARNEFESFQVVLRSEGGDTADVSLALGAPLTGPNGAALAIENVTLYRQAYYAVGKPSNSEGAAGLWPDPLIPARDTYFGEERKAFPLTVPAGESRAVWVDVLVPQGATPGLYQGSIVVRVGGQVQGTIPLSLRVGSFELPSTATLKSAFGMGWADPCVAHTGNVNCDKSWNEPKANELRVLYLRAALDHRFTISDTDYQPPFGSSAAPFAEHVLPLLAGSGPTRLPGARLTAVRLDGGDDDLAKWIDYAKQHDFFDRLLYYPVDEPSDQDAWQQFSAHAKKLHTVDPSARILITGTIQDAKKYGVVDDVDLFIPVVNYLHDAPDGNYVGDQTAAYEAWRKASPGRELWAYQSCMSHGCGDCGTTTDAAYFTGWPQRVVDSSAVQDRSFPWIAFQLGLQGELYFTTTHQLASAWDPDGQCAFAGSGDGTLFYPGKTSQIGGTHDIPIESLRMKLIREGMEDFEYLTLAAQKDPAAAHAIAAQLFPLPYQCAQPPEKLAAARTQLFELLDESGAGGAAGAGGSGASGQGGAPAGQGGASPGGKGGNPSGGQASGGAGQGGAVSGGASGAGNAGGASGGKAGQSASSGGSSGARAGQGGVTQSSAAPGDEDSGCGCRAAGTSAPVGQGSLLLVLGAALVRRRRRGGSQGRSGGPALI